MIVFCEECGTKNIIDPAQARQQQEPIRCRECNDMLRYSPPASERAKLKRAKPVRPEPERVKPEKINKELPGTPALLHLELRLGRRLIVMSNDRPTVTMGRQRHNDIEIVDTRVSRSHARIEFRQGRFILIDHSTNGTYVKLNGSDDSLNLKKSELLLEGAGAITLGRKIIDRPSRTIYFTLKS